MKIKPKIIYLIDSPTPQTYGIIGIILFGISAVIVLGLGFIYNQFIMLIGALLFILGGFVGRAIEKRNKTKTGENVQKGVVKKLG